MYKKCIGCEEGLGYPSAYEIGRGYQECGNCGEVCDVDAEDVGLLFERLENRISNLESLALAQSKIPGFLK